MSKHPSGDDPLSAYAAVSANAAPLSTTPHLPVFQGPFRPSFDDDDYTNKSLHYVDLEDNHTNVESRSLLISSALNGHGTLESFVEYDEEDDDEEDDETNHGFEPPTKVEKTIMVASIGVVLLFSVAAGLTTVCDWVL
jgi:hypothetical protein